MFRINDHIIGGSKAYIIAEIGINHQGSVHKCRKLIHKAKIAGADAVPVPTDNPELVDKSTKPDCTFVKAMFNINFYFYLYEILTLYIFIIHSRMYLMVFAYSLR